MQVYVATVISVMEDLLSKVLTAVSEGVGVYPQLSEMEQVNYEHKILTSDAVGNILHNVLDEKLTSFLESIILLRMAARKQGLAKGIGA